MSACTLLQAFAVSTSKCDRQTGNKFTLATLFPPTQFFDFVPPTRGKAFIAFCTHQQISWIRKKLFVLQHVLF
jgi:hypothetical protein